jgi:hypothetical protein
MNNVYRSFFIAGLVLLLCSSFIPLMAQQASSSRDTGSAPSAAASSAPAASAPSSRSSVPSASYSGNSSPGFSSMSGSRDMGYASASGGSGGGGYTPNYSQYVNPYTSFWSYDSYSRASLLFSFLNFQYPGVFSGGYFSRFFNNNEPIITPQTALAMRIPSSNAKMLVAAADRLSAIRNQYVADGQSSRLLLDPEVKTLIQKVKFLARQIYKYPALEYVSFGKSGNLVGDDSSQNSESNMEQMDSLIRMLQNQFHEVWESENPSLVSIEQLSLPSPISLAKGIEKLANRLEKTANKS